MKKTEQKTATTERVANEDVDDIIGLAAEMKDADDDTLSQEDLEDVASELDIEPEYVEQAREKLEEQREDERNEAMRAQAAKKQLVTYGAAAAAALIVVIGGWAFASASSLHGVYSQVQAQQAQVENVLERQKAIQKQFASQPDSPDKNAELVGAQNRIRVESQRYSALAARYNARAAAFPGSLVHGIAGLPAQVPLKLSP